jgi:hypothetical protein
VRRLEEGEEEEADGEGRGEEGRRGRGGGSSCWGRRVARWLPKALRPPAPGDTPGSQWLRRGVQQMASDCAVPSSSSSSSSSSSFRAEEPESPLGCQTLEWVVSRTHTTIFLALGKLGTLRLPEAAAAAWARLVSATALRPEPRMPGPPGRRAWREVAAAWAGGAPPAQTLLFPCRAASVAPSFCQMLELGARASQTSGLGLREG